MRAAGSETGGALRVCGKAPPPGAAVERGHPGMNAVRSEREVVLAVDGAVATLTLNRPAAMNAMLEDLGFCRKGEGGPFVEAGHITFGGRIPINTHGGMLSYARPGLPGGFFHIVEMARQLRGEADGRQVDGAELALCHSLGGGFATNATIILGTEPRA